MRSMVPAAIITSIVWWGAIVSAQKPTSTPEELDKAMKRAKPAMDAAAKAVDGKAFAAANKQLDAIKQVMTDTQAFWVLYKKDDAVKANKDVIAKIVEVQTRFAATPPLRPDAARSALKYIEAACKVCHDKYRTRDADNNWILKPGTVKLTP